MNERLVALQRRAMRKGAGIYVAGTAVLAASLVLVLPGGLVGSLVFLLPAIAIAFLYEWRQERSIEPPVPEGVLVECTFDETGMELRRSDGPVISTSWAALDHVGHDPATRLSHWKARGGEGPVFCPEEVFPARQVRAAQDQIARH